MPTTTEQPADIWAGERTIKRFRVAREGQTVDGRTLSQQDILDIAETYNPTEYTARINVEHMGGWSGLDGTQYPALGDVIACDAVLETFKIGGADVKLMSLYATLSALPVLVEANQKGQKLFTSIEYYKKFADTDRAYLVGLAVTDTPASRGTQPLKFSKQSQTLATNFMELNMANQTIQTSELTEPTAETPQNLTTAEATTQEDGFLQKLSKMFSKKTELTKEQEDAILQGFSSLKQDLSEQNSRYDDLLTKFNQLSADFDNLQQSLANQTVTTVTAPVGTGHQLTDY